jgi:hypothetical protein
MKQTKSNIINYQYDENDRDQSILRALYELDVSNCMRQLQVK